jgi:glycosyltransferase involved in cell wall biosynthesis
MKKFALERKILMQEKTNNLLNPAVIIFNSLLLPPSQTFIRDPAEKLERFKAYYVGSRRVQGLDLSPERTLVVNQDNFLGKIEEQLFKFTGFAPRLYRQVQQLKPVLIHAQFGLSGALILPWARSLGIPLIVHYRGADATIDEASSLYTSLNHWLYFQRKEQLKRETRLFIAVSKFIKDKLIEKGFPPEKIITHYHGVDLDRFYPDPEIERKPIVLFVGRLTEKKGCEYLIQAMAQVQLDLPDVELVIIGDGPLKPQLEAQAAQLLYRYQFLGVQPPDAVKNWMNRAWLLAAPSVTASQGDSEGLPNVVLEAQAMALPVVSTAHAGIPEAVIHGDTGFLTTERDIQGLANYSLQLLKDTNLWQRFSVKGRENMKANFDRTKQTRLLESIYQSVLYGDW